MTVATLPEHWSTFLRDWPESGMDYQVVSVTLRDGRVIEDVAIVQQSLVSQVRGHTDIPFDPVDLTAIELTHRKWDFQHEGAGRNRAAI
jgi:hypothetical protein